MSSQRNLFGGAITVVLPLALIDASFHFDALAHDNDAVSRTVHSIESLESLASPETTPSPILLEGSQQIAKFNRQFEDKVHILLALYRVTGKNVDLVLSANIPITTEAGGVLGSDDLNSSKEAFLAAARSLKIADFGLFA
ncbi:hypothetical protein EW145_g5493 [Phellinidium pouzarii]|uniref:Uncharacterized protein n=1 Tax=Phellinidium pouzarii TaxID=167371 RepID=A0A4S4L145_9AGAM|nr:hypothetical protein EW145_g5493 [Phellinidium pouzarii]